MHRIRTMAALAACALLAGCATMVNPGKSRTVSPAESGTGTSARTARLRFRNWAGLQAVYENGRQLTFQDEADHDAHVLFCETWDGTTMPAGRGMVWVTVDRSCMNAILFPYIELDKSVPHTLEIVTDRGRATVNVKAGMHIQWFWFNGVWGPAAPIGWAVDIARGSWNYFGSVDVAQAMQRGTQVSSGGTR